MSKKERILNTQPVKYLINCVVEFSMKNPAIVKVLSNYSVKNISYYVSDLPAKPNDGGSAADLEFGNPFCVDIRFEDKEGDERAVILDEHRCYFAEEDIHIWFNESAEKYKFLGIDVRKHQQEEKVFSVQNIRDVIEVLKLADATNIK